ncbi:DUF803-domain-containing protein [Aspergillus campestris IBT 28561]|uniref:DUF803-domain-containing protein n=1 Tax=Aspergillus campestris (strain IBT 28561) TaxID=1392248 RepID=A0A2I1D5Z7_ASPC2|nr:DUF803-domain-containing protein [Aspergillus campestris IBT 28561]PKY05302.1 DUF803-domain-containing protein [Aspergillus campestris IBT 28561]
MNFPSSMAHAALEARSGEESGRPASYKAIGISLAVASGLFIGVSFVIKKVGLLKANVKYNEEAGEGYGYLKNFWWWLGMTLMIVGEICNFVAYAFVDAILVTPLGALSVVVTTILSAIFLKERLSFVGKVGCFTCILGSVVIALNAPEQSSVRNIQDMKHFVIAPGFLTYAGIIVVGSAFTALWVGPRYGKKSMFVYISICSLVGGLSVVATQGLGAAILAQINGESQFKEWFLYVLLVFVIATLLTEIIYLNKALNIFNAALVTPTYYVFFTSATIATSAILFQGFKGSGMEIATVVLGFLQICAGVVLLQVSKSAKDVPDAAVFKGDLNQIREVVTQEEPESEPKADSIRGAAAIVRRFSTQRRTMEAEEARRYFRDRHEDQKQPAENEVIEWDGLRRRKTVLGDGPTMARSATFRTTSTRTPSLKSPLPPLGMSRFPDEDDRPSTTHSGNSFLEEIRARTRTSSIVHHPWQPIQEEKENEKPTLDTSYRGASTTTTITSEPDPSPHTKRQFSFNMLHRLKGGSSSSTDPQDALSPKSSSPRGFLRRHHQEPKDSEEERLGLVRGDSREETYIEKLDRTDSNESDDWSPEYRHRPTTSIDRPQRLRVNPLPPLPDEAPYDGPDHDPYPAGGVYRREEEDGRGWRRYEDGK